MGYVFEMPEAGVGAILVVLPHPISIGFLGWCLRCCPKSEGFEFLFGHLQLHHFRLPGFYGPAPFKTAGRPFFFLAAISATAAIDGCSAVCAHGVKVGKRVLMQWLPWSRGNALSWSSLFGHSDGGCSISASGLGLLQLVAVG